MHAISGALLLATVATALPAAAAGFTDPTVDPSTYQIHILPTDPTVQVDIHAITDAHPGAGLELGFTNVGGPIALLSMVGFIRDGFAWNPATDGAIASLGFTNDRYVDGGDAYLNGALTTFSRALVAQGGQYYVAAIADEGQLRQAWYTTSAAALQAADFARFDFGTGVLDASQHPDFSAQGATLGFGFLNRFLFDTNGAPYALDASFRYDNIGITVNAAPVPEPGAASLLAAGLALLVWAGRQRLR